MFPMSGVSGEGFNLPSVHLYLTQAYSVANGNTTVETPLDSVLHDTHGFYPGGGSRGLVIPSGMDGIYAITAHGNYTNNSTNHRGLYLRVNGTSVISDFRPNNSAIGVPLTAAINNIRLKGGDYISHVLYHNITGGGTLATNTGIWGTYIALSMIGRYMDTV